MWLSDSVIKQCEKTVAKDPSVLAELGNLTGVPWARLSLLYPQSHSFILLFIRVYTNPLRLYVAPTNCVTYAVEAMTKC